MPDDVGRHILKKGSRYGGKDPAVVNATTKRPQATNEPRGTRVAPPLVMPAQYEFGEKKSIILCLPFVAGILLSQPSEKENISVP